MHGNRLLTAFILAIATYWFAGIFLPGHIVSIIVGGCSLAIGGFAFYRYGREAYGVLFHGHRSERGDGAHLAVLGMALISFSAVYGGAFSLLWNVMDQPSTWLGTAISSFGRACGAAGFALMYYSPEIGRPDPRTPPYVWFVIILTCVALLAYFAGTQSAPVDTVSNYWR